MEEIVLAAEAGRATGSGPARRLRAQDRIPAVVYGADVEAPVSVSVARRELRAALTTEAGQNAIINLDVGGDRHLTIVRDLQRDPVRNTVVHVDFVTVNRDETLTIEVPIELVGEAVAVNREQGVVDHQMFTLTVQTKPGNIPNNITVDISEMVIGDSIRVSDLQLPSGVTTEVDPDEAVATAQVSRAAIEAEQLEEVQELEQLAAAGITEGDLDEGAEGEGEGAEGGEEPAGE
jgi:large subunit ribosomal protein L25